jgi:hypothetical protein
LNPKRERHQQWTTRRAGVDGTSLAHSHLIVEGAEYVLHALCVAS